MLDDDVTLELHGLEVLGVDMFIKQKLHKKLSEPVRFLAVEYECTAVPWTVSLPVNNVGAEGEGVVLFDLAPPLAVSLHWSSTVVLPIYESLTRHVFDRG